MLCDKNLAKCRHAMQSLDPQKSHRPMHLFRLQAAAQCICAKPSAGACLWTAMLVVGCRLAAYLDYRSYQRRRCALFPVG